MDKKEFYKQTGFIELPQRKVVSTANKIKSFQIPSMLFDLLAKYPNVTFEELVDELTDKYGIEKANYILKKLSGGTYDLEEFYTEEEYKTR